VEVPDVEKTLQKHCVIGPPFTRSLGQKIILNSQTLFISSFTHKCVATAQKKNNYKK